MSKIDQTTNIKSLRTLCVISFSTADYQKFSLLAEKTDNFYPKLIQGNDIKPNIAVASYPKDSINKITDFFSQTKKEHSNCLNILFYQNEFDAKNIINFFNENVDVIINQQIKTLPKNLIEDLNFIV